MIKKISSTIALATLYASLAMPTWAQTVDPCPASGTGGKFQDLCNYNADTLGKVIQGGITILFIVATIASLFFLIFGGIKWISSGGDKGKLEESRNMLVAAAVGLIITFASYFILNIILEIFGLPNVNDYELPSLL